MFKSLRSRLIFSHILPLLVIVPIMGITLIYVLETAVVLPELVETLSGEITLMARLAKGQGDLWYNPAQAQVFVDEVSQDLSSRLMLLDAQGRLLASSDAADAGQVAQIIINQPILTQVQAEKMIKRTMYSSRLRSEIADVFLAVLGPDQQMVGIIRLSHQLDNVQEVFLRLRYLVLGVLLVGLVLGLLVGLFLALDMERPLQRVTQAIGGLAQGQQFTTLTVGGPSEIRSLLRSVNTLVDRLRGLEQAQRQLLANLVHELGRPLGAVHSAIRALMGRSGQDAAIRQELLQGIEGEIRRLERLLDDLAHLHDLVLGTLELNRQPITLDTWLPDILVSWREAAESKGLQWRANIAPHLPPLQADPDRLAQVVGNLVSNAIKYTPGQGDITISAGAENGAVRITVSDTGPGIPRDEQAKIFIPLYRSQSSSRFPQGMGLGLTIAHDLVLAHGGRLEVDSEPGQGSRFTIWLPQTPPTTSEPAAE